MRQTETGLIDARTLESMQIRDSKSRQQLLGGLDDLRAGHGAFMAESVRRTKVQMRCKCCPLRPMPPTKQNTQVVAGWVELTLHLVTARQPSSMNKWLAGGRRVVAEQRFVAEFFLPF